jgi:hypothetical protein
MSQRATQLQQGMRGILPAIQDAHAPPTHPLARWEEPGRLLTTKPAMLLYAADTLQGAIMHQFSPYLEYSCLGREGRCQQSKLLHAVKRSFCPHLVEHCYR